PRSTRASDADESRDTFLSRMSHDLRTPLAAIKASIGVVLAHEPDGTSEPIRRLFKNIDFAADQMEELIANLGEVARFQMPGFQINLEPCDLRELARQAARAAEPLLRRREQQLILAVPAKPIETQADPPRLHRCLLNVLGNAHKFGREQGTVRMSV